MPVVSFGVADSRINDAYRRIKEALGFTGPTRKIVIEMEATHVIKVYVVGYVMNDQLAGLADALEVIACKDVTVADDATVTVVSEGGG